MNANTLSFDIAYDGYYEEIMKCIKPNINILEIGEGAHPSLADRSRISCTMVDPDAKEINKSPDDVRKSNLFIKDLNEGKQYDLILTKMVLEHIENPDAFHKKIFEILKSDGKAIHFFAGRNSIPSFVNRILPESISNALLKLLQNRDTSEHPKYPAFYRRTKGHTKSQLLYFRTIGFEIAMYNSYVGHKYFKSIPILKQLEKLYTSVLVRLNIKSLATVALII